MATSFVSFYYRNSFRDIQCQNTLKTFGIPCISKQIKAYFHTFKYLRHNSYIFGFLTFNVQRIRQMCNFFSQYQKFFAARLGIGCCNTRIYSRLTKTLLHHIEHDRLTNQ